MKLEHSFTVPVDVQTAWNALLEIDRIAPCMPGASVDSVDGESFTGTVQVKLGPVKLIYKGDAAFIEKDHSSYRAVIDARGRDTRGNGTAAATITATCSQAEDETRVDIVTDLNVTGKPAQFGRSVIVDVGDKLIGRFASDLAIQLQEGSVGASANTQPASAMGSTSRRIPQHDAIDLLGTAGPAVFKRLTLPGVLLTIAAVWLLRRRRRHTGGAAA